MAAVNASVEVQSQAEVSEQFWRDTFEQKSEEAKRRVEGIESSWERALALTVAEEMHSQLMDMRGQFLLHGWENLLFISLVFWGELIN